MSAAYYNEIDPYAAQWLAQAIRLADAHRISSGVGIRVGVLDSGVDRQHRIDHQLGNAAGTLEVGHVGAVVGAHDRGVE